MTELLVVRDIGKSFGPTVALDGVSLSAGTGEVHAVLGENGAGKSTLMKILAGALLADQGRIELDGEHFAPDGPLAARDAGVAIVYQEPQLCDHLTVAENVLLGVEPCRWGMLRRGLMREKTAEVIANIASADQQARIVPDALVGALSPGDRQLVAIARALAQSSPRVLILDEPTSALSAGDTERLFEVVSRLRERGMCVLYISHFLEEVQRVADRYTVLRDGRSVRSGDMSDTTLDELVEAMVGRVVAGRTTRAVREPGDVVLRVDEIAGKKLPKRATLELRQGEVLGLAGLVGSGRTELLRSIFGLDAVKSGEVRVGAFVGKASPAKRLAQGVGMLSEDRKGEGLAASMTVADNLMLSRLPRWVVPSKQRSSAREWIERLAIKCRDGEQPVSGLSGGNQQKVALARLLHHDVDVLLLDEPTRGIDVASRQDVYHRIDELAGEGKAILVVSSYLPELMSLCDRVAVMRRGVLGPARPVAEIDEHSLLLEASA